MVGSHVMILKSQTLFKKAFFPSLQPELGGIVQIIGCQVRASHSDAHVKESILIYGCRER